MTSVTLSVGIMHAAFDSQRAQMVSDLIGSLATSQEDLEQQVKAFAVVPDRERRGPWWTARQAWRWHAKTGATHHLLLQDDVAVCKDFLSAVKAAAEAVPDSILTFFNTADFHTSKAMKRGDAWIVLAEVWGQAILMPHDVLVDFLAWEAKHIRPKLRHDDTRVTLYAHTHDKPLYGSVPSLAQHIGEGHSLLGHDASRFVGIWWSKTWPGGQASAANRDWSLPDNPITERHSRLIKLLTRMYVVP